MKDKLDAILLEALQSAKDVIQSGAAFAQEQMPLLITEVLNWYFVYYLVMLLCAVATAFLWFKAETFAIRWLKDNNACEDTWFGGYILLGSILRAILARILALTFNLQWLKIWIAPKLWLIEYTAKLVGN